MGKKALLLGLALLLAFTALAFYPFETEELARTVLDRARERTGIPLDAASSRFRIAEGLTLERVTASVGIPIGRYDVELDRIRFEHRLLALLAGRMELGRIWLERPRVTVMLGRTDDEPPVSPPPSAPPVPEQGAREEPTVEQADAVAAPPLASRVVLAPSEVRMTSGEFLVGDGFALKGVDVVLESVGYDRRALTALHALSSEGTIGIAEAVLGSLLLHDVSARLSTKNGRFALDELSFSSRHGAFQGSFHCDFNVLPFRYRTSFVADPVAIDGLGSGVLRLEAEGFGTQSRHLSGAGTLELAPGPIPDLSFLREIHPELAGKPHRGARAEVEVRDNVARVRGLRFETTVLALDVEGSVDLEGPLDLTLTFRDGERTETYRLGGTREAPVLTRRD